MPCCEVFEQINQGRRHHGRITEGTFVFAMGHKGIGEETVNKTYLILIVKPLPIYSSI